jgi:hypothetical protein
VHKKQQEERHSDMQAQITALRQFLETTQLATVQTGQQVQAENTTQTTEVQHMTSIISRERHVMKIATRALEFPMTELKEQAKALSHIDLVVSQLPIEILYGLQSSVTEELQVHAVSTSLELTKTVTDKDMLQEEYDQLRQERDEATQKEERVKQGGRGGL